MAIAGEGQLLERGMRVPGLLHLGAEQQARGCGPAGDWVSNGKELEVIAEAEKVPYATHAYSNTHK